MKGMEGGNRTEQTRTLKTTGSVGVDKAASSSLCLSQWTAGYLPAQRQRPLNQGLANKEIAIYQWTVKGSTGNN